MQRNAGSKPVNKEVLDYNIPIPPTPLRKPEAETLKENRQGGVLPQHGSQHFEEIKRIPSPRPGKLNSGNPEEIRSRKYYPGGEGGRKWREIDTSRQGKFSLITVVDKGIRISSKVRKLKNGEKYLGKNALNKKKYVKEDVFDDKKKIFASVWRPQPYWLRIGKLLKLLKLNPKTTNSGVMQS